MSQFIETPRNQNKKCLWQELYDDKILYKPFPVPKRILPCWRCWYSKLYHGKYAGLLRLKTNWLTSDILENFLI